MIGSEIAIESSEWSVEYLSRDLRCHESAVIIILVQLIVAICQKKVNKRLVYVPESRKLTKAGAM